MDALVTLNTRLEQLLAYFTRGVLDVPDGLLDRNAVLMLNGVAYEARLGRSADDPLVRLIARGPAGYRFVAKALLHALERASAATGALDIDGATATGTLLLQGTLRGSGEPFAETLDVAITLTPSAAIHTVDVKMNEAALARLKEARAS